MVDEVTTTQQNNHETPVNVPLNLHVKSPCHEEYIDRGVNYENSINAIAQPIIVTKSDGKNSGETDDNKYQCEKTNDIVPKTGPDIHYEVKEVNRVRDKSVKTMAEHVKHLSETNKKWNKVKKRGSNFTKKGLGGQGQSKGHYE